MEESTRTHKHFLQAVSHHCSPVEHAHEQSQHTTMVQQPIMTSTLALDNQQDDLYPAHCDQYGIRIKYRLL